MSEIAALAAAESNSSGDGRFNLSGFINHTHDFSRGYTFYLQFVNTTYLGETPTYLVKSSSLPAQTIETTEANWQGNVYKLGTTNSYTDFTVDFNVDIKDDLRKSLYEWSRNIHDVISNHHGDPSIYMQNFTIEHIDHKTGTPIITYTMHQAFPTTVGEMSLDYSTKDIATFSVTFAYQWHTMK